MARILTMTEAGWHLYGAGFNGYRIPTFIAIGMAESRLNAEAININDHDPTSVAYMSLDLGWLQMNTYWWIDKKWRVQDAFSPSLNARMAWEAFKAAGGSNAAPQVGYALWNSWKNNLHLPFLSDAVKAWKAMGSV
jgi:hypothetical protein